MASRGSSTRRLGVAAKADRSRGQLQTLDLDLHPNEASDLLPVEEKGILDGHGWDLAFWTVLDEGPIENCMAVLGHKRGSDHSEESWEIARPRFQVDANAGKTEDAEACARRDGWIYVIGSHYGSKSGPIERKRAFVARFEEKAAGGDLRSADTKMEIALNSFRLHRAVNDALRAFGPPLLEPGPKAVKSFVSRARKKAGKKSAQRISKSDVPINVEGAAFTESGSLLLGLRHPATAEGHPIVAEVAGVDRTFEDRRAAPVARRFWVIESAGTKRRPAGIRAMHRRGRDLHVITGSLESEDEDAVLIEERPEAARAKSEHHQVRMSGARDGGVLAGTRVHDFSLGNVEGLAADSSGRFFYVTDEDDRVHMRYLREKSPSGSRRAAKRKSNSTRKGTGQTGGNTATRGKPAG
jgi:hypothetical protein